MPTSQQFEEAKAIVRGFTLLALATGAVPVPAASAAIALENTVLFAAVGGALGAEVTVASVLTSIGTLGTLNLAGRALFMEGAKLLGWATGPFGLPAVCALGAATAAGQTWALGQLAIAIARNGGIPLPVAEARHILARADTDFAAGTWREGRVVRAKVR